MNVGNPSLFFQWYGEIKNYNIHISHVEFQLNNIYGFYQVVLNNWKSTECIFWFGILKGRYVGMSVNVVFCFIQKQEEEKVTSGFGFGWNFSTHQNFTIRKLWFFFFSLSLSLLFSLFVSDEICGISRYCFLLSNFSELYVRRWSSKMN